MTSFVLRRVLFLPVLWLAVTLVIFAMLAPLGPYQRLVLYVDMDPTKSAKQGPEEMQRLIDTYGLDEPFLVQYSQWLGRVVKGDLGWSKTAQAPVGRALRDRLPATLELTLFAAVPMVLLAIWSGVRSAQHHDRWPDHTLWSASVLGMSLPPFVVGLALLILFYGAVRWFPPGRLGTWAEQAVLASTFTRYTHLNTVDAALNGRPDIMVDALRHLVLPVTTLVVLGWAGLMRVTRSAMLEVLGQEYVTTARAKGLGEGLVLRRHVLRNAMVPVATSTIGMLLWLLSGVILIEQVFNYPGLGSWVVEASRVFDVPAVIGITLFSATLIVVGNLAADVLYAVLDPRIRYG